MSRCFKFVLVGHNNHKECDSIESLESNDIITYGEISFMKDLVDGHYIDEAVTLTETDLSLFREKFYPDEEFLEHKKGWIFRKKDLLSIKKHIENDIKVLQDNEKRIQKELIERLETDIRSNDPDINDTLDEVLSNIREGNFEYEEELEDLSYLVRILNKMIDFIDFYEDKYGGSFNYENLYDEMKFIIQVFY